MNINLKIIAFGVLITFLLVSCKNERNGNEENDTIESAPVNQSNDLRRRNTTDSTVTNISADSTQAEPSAITRP